ncbi:MAG TPA: ribosomal protein S18-alanine N-acetyltransferase [Geobacteraceae bacterium]
MNESDLDAVLAIESDSFPHPWSRTHFLDELNSPHSFPMVALDEDGAVIGYICPMLVLDEGHILNVAVRKQWRRQGIGELLVEKVIGECRDRKAAFISLEVRPSNSGAIALYERLGFFETGRRKRYYENGEDAILMELISENGKESGDAV